MSDLHPCQLGGEVKYSEALNPFRSWDPGALEASEHFTPGA